MSDEERPSVQAANSVMRVLTDKPLKFTVTVHKADGSKIEFQSDDAPKLHYDDQARALWIASGTYANVPIMAYEQGMIITTEENAK